MMATDRLHRPRLLLRSCAALVFLCASAGTVSWALEPVNQGPAMRRLRGQDRDLHDCSSRFRFFGLGSSEGEGGFYYDYVFPGWHSQDKRSLLFVNPRQFFESTGAEQTSVGLGLRHIFDDRFILGANVFYDFAIQSIPEALKGRNNRHGPERRFADTTRNAARSMARPHVVRHSFCR